MRNPSLHIGKDDFITVLRKAGIADPENTADRIFEIAVPYHIKNRYVVKGNAKLTRQLTRMVDASNIADYSPEKFNGLLDSLRRVANHRYIQEINKGSSDWMILKEVLIIATGFVKTFKFERAEEGYKAFLNSGIKLMGRNYGLSKFKYHAEKIHKLYESEMVLEQDHKPDDTIAFWQCWKEAMNEHAGGELDIVVPEKMVHMIYGRQEADELKAEYKDWIEAQFEQLAFLNAIPELSQFYGPNAKNRYEKYMLDKKRGNKTATRKTDTKKEEEYNLPESMSPAQREYFRALRDKNAGK